jgi:geranylgeranyl transferase type-2 subunit alpha
VRTASSATQSHVRLSILLDRIPLLLTDGICSDCAWHHRRWVISKFTVDFENELALCKEFLRQDQRNFHCWNYRRFVVAAGNVSPEAELAYSQEKIQENFSNYSAFHHRSNFIKTNATSLMTVLPAEFSIVENAIFTEPDDQSAWWYHQFLLTWAVKEIESKQGSGAEAEAAALATWLVDMLQQQLELVRSLYEIEPTCTWVMNSLVAMITLLCSQALAAAAAGTVDTSALLTERSELLQKLLDVDPNHRHRYKYLLLNVTLTN